MDLVDEPVPAAGKYADLESIGSGGLGEVYRARSLETGEQVAIKVVRADADQSVAWHRIRRELTALVSLSGHPHVVQLIELVDVDGAPGIVMEYAPFGSVARFVADPGGEPPSGRTATLPEVVLIGRHAAAALVVAHGQSVVHRDVKPHNLLIGAAGRVMLCDFGVAAMSRTRAYRTRTDARSLGYSSPEELDGEIDVTTATDVYSLGATLLHLAHGAPPTLAERLALWTPPPATAQAQGTLDAVIAACLHPDASQRPPATEVLERLERLDWTLPERIVAFDVARWTPLEPVAPPSSAPPLDARGRSTVTTLVGEPRTPPARPTSDPARRWPVVVASAVACIAVATIGGMALRHRPSPPPTAAGDAPPGRSVWAAWSDGEPNQVAPPGAPVIVDRPPGLVDVRSVVWPFDRLGECLVQRADVDALVGVDCEQPHDLQRIAIAELDGDRFGSDAPFEAAEIDREIRVVCERSLEAFVGVAADTSTFDVAHTRPSETGWASGDRAFQCLVGIHGRRTINSAAGSRR